MPLVRRKGDLSMRPQFFSIALFCLASGLHPTAEIPGMGKEFSFHHLSQGVRTMSRFALIEPGPGSVWNKSWPLSIKWTKIGAMPASVRIILADVELTRIIHVIADPAPNTGAFEWRIPDSIPPGEYKIRIRVLDSDLSGTSESFKIVSGPGPIQAKAKADLAITGIWTKPSDPSKPGEYVLEVVYANNGAIDSGPYWFIVERTAVVCKNPKPTYTGGPYPQFLPPACDECRKNPQWWSVEAPQILAKERIYGLAKGKPILFTSPVFKEQPHVYYNFKIQIDGANEVDENDKSNNERVLNGPFYVKCR